MSTEKNKAPLVPITHIILTVVVTLVVSAFVGYESLTNHRTPTDSLEFDYTEFIEPLQTVESEYYSTIISNHGEHKMDMVTFIVGSNGSPDLLKLPYPYVKNGLQNTATIEYAKSDRGYSYIVYKYNPVDTVTTATTYTKGAYKVKIYLTNQ